MRLKTLALGVIASSLAAGGVSAQTVGLGTTKGGATAAVAAAIAKVVSSKSGIQMRTQTMGGSQQYIPVVNAGELEFGIANIMQTKMAIDGTGLSKGRKYSNLRMVATMMKFRLCSYVANNSSIKSIQDLKGKRVPHGFKASPLMQMTFSGVLANGNVSWGDVKKVPAVALRQHWDMFAQGKIDAIIGIAGTGRIKELNTKVSGGVRCLPFSHDPADIKRTHQSMPGWEPMTLKPSKKFPGIKTTTPIFAYDYMLWANKGVSDDVAYKVAKAMYENEADLKATGALWATHSSKTMGKRQPGLPYHPGAVKFYKEVGVWQGGS